MKALWPINYVHADGRKFAYDRYTVDNDERYTKGRQTLPDCEGGYPYRYTIEFASAFSPKHIDSEDPEGIIHNMMVFSANEDGWSLAEFKTRAKSGIEAYPDTFLYRFTLAAVNLVTNEVGAWCNEFGRGMFEYPLSKESLVDVATLMAIRERLGLGADVVTKVVKAMLEGANYADAFERALPVVVVEGELEGLVREVLKENEGKVREWKGGKLNIASMFIGTVMRKKAGLNAKEVVRVIGEELEKYDLT